MKRSLILGLGLLTMLISLVLSGCGAQQLADGQERKIEGDDTPDWARFPEKGSTEEERAFVGESRNWSMESDARSDAEKDAYLKAAKAIGVYVRSKINEVVSSVDMGANILTPAVVTDQLTKMEASGMTQGRIDEYHVEKWEKMDAGKIKYYYKVTVRYMVPRDFAVKFMQQTLEEQRQKAQAEKEKVMLDRALEKIKTVEADDF